MVNIQTICFMVLALVDAFLLIKYFYLKQDFKFLEKYVNDMGAHVSEQSVRFNKLLKILVDNAKEDNTKEKQCHNLKYLDIENTDGKEEIK